MEKSAADVTLVQEVKTAEVAGCCAAERAAARAGWSLSVTQAVRTDKGGVSAGVAVAARSHFGMSRHKTNAEMECCRGRIAANHVSIACKGGIHFVSLYLWCVEGLSRRNLDVLQCVAQLLASLHVPWVLAADFNLEPHVLQESGWLELVRGAIAAPEQPTCGKRCYDYLVVSKGLLPSVVGVAVVDDAGLHPHSPSRLFIRGRPRQVQARMLVAPRKLPASLPIGCLDDPRRHAGRIELCEDSLEALAKLAFSLAEDELSFLAGHNDQEKDMHGGRAEGPKFAMKVAVGPVGPPGSASPNARASLLLGRALQVG